MVSVDSLAREIRAYAAELFQGDLSRERMDLVASQIEEVDFTDSLNEQLHHIAARVKGEKFHPSGKVFIDEALERLDVAVDNLTAPTEAQPRTPAGELRDIEFGDLRWRIIDSAEVPAGEKGALLALLGSIERVEGLADRIEAERASVDRGMQAYVHTPANV